MSAEIRRQGIRRVVAWKEDRSGFLNAVYEDDPEAIALKSTGSDPFARRFARPTPKSTVHRASARRRSPRARPAKRRMASQPAPRQSRRPEPAHQAPRPAPAHQQPSGPEVYQFLNRQSKKLLAKMGMKYLSDAELASLLQMVPRRELIRFLHQKYQMNQRNP